MAAGAPAGMFGDSAGVEKPQAAPQALPEREATASSFVATHHSRKELNARELIHWAISNGFNPDETLKKNYNQNIKSYFRRMAVPIPQKFWERFNDLPAVRPPSASKK